MSRVGQQAKLPNGAGRHSCHVLGLQPRGPAGSGKTLFSAAHVRGPPEPKRNRGSRDSTPRRHTCSSTAFLSATSTNNKHKKCYKLKHQELHWPMSKNSQELKRKKNPCSQTKGMGKWPSSREWKVGQAFSRAIWERVSHRTAMRKFQFRVFVLRKQQKYSEY